MNTKTREARTTPIDQAIAGFDHYDAIIDARSPSEYDLDHLPGALNMPVLNDAQRERVGTLYKQVGAFEAKRIGAVLVSHNIGALLAGPLANRPRDWHPLVYCWRGGNRSGSLATVMARVGWRVDVLEGGYRAFRQHVIGALSQLPVTRRYRVVAGRTGSGKSLLLEQLARLGAQVLDLEAIARHRGSVLGQRPGETQPSQKRFETLIWDFLRRTDPALPIFVEAESRKVGQCQVPEALIETIRQSPGVLIQATDPVRCELLMQDYRHFIEDPERLIDRLTALIPHHGHAHVQSWSEMALTGHWHELIQALLHQHYDPSYERSMARNFARLASFEAVSLADASAASLERTARAILNSSAEPAAQRG